MRGLIGDLLDTGRIESGTLSVAPEPSEVAALAERARRTVVSGVGRRRPVSTHGSGRGRRRRSSRITTRRP